MMVSSTNLLMNLLMVVARVLSKTLIFLPQKCKNITVFAIFQDRNFNVMFANNFVKF